jgi:ADP-ribose pyrophosphatase YjhB (NUDIX family)
VAIPVHIRRLRERLGDELLLVPAVAALVRDERGRVLLVRNAESDVWTLPGGLLEPDERPEDAAEREVEEESGLRIEVGRVLDVFAGPPFRHTYANGDRIAVMVAVYEGRVIGGVARPDGDETAAVEWHEPSTFATLPLSTRAAAVLERLL